MRIRPVREPRVHAKLLAWDDDHVVVTSQNWLSADPGPADDRKEIGLYLHAAGAARRVIDYLKPIANREENAIASLLQIKDYVNI